MEDILGFWDKLHQKFVQGILNILLDNKEKDEVRTEKIKYTLTSIGRNKNGHFCNTSDRVYISL